MTAKLSNLLKSLLLFLCAFALLTGCVSPKPPPGVRKDLWVGELTGMIRGPIRISSWQSGENKNIQITEGRFTMHVDSAWGGFSDISVQGDVRGRIKDGLMEAKISGSADDSFFSGVLIGTVSEIQGFGTWRLDVPEEDAGTYTGEWTLQKQ